MAKPFIVEDLGITVEKYFSLKDQGFSDEKLCNKVFYISITALRNWKIKNGIIGQRVRMNYTPRVATDERIEINNRMRKEGKKIAEIAEALKFKKNSYMEWRYKMRKKGFEVL